jgi:hypothetical protein
MANETQWNDFRQLMFRFRPFLGHRPAQQNWPSAFLQVPAEMATPEGR